MSTGRFSAVRIGWALGSIATLALAVACNEITGASQDGRVTLSIAVPRTGANLVSDGASATGATSADVIIASNGHVLDLRDADLTVADVRLERREAGGDEDSDSDSDGRRGDGDEIFHSGPETFELPLDGDVLTLFSAPIPAGTYDELELDLAFLRLRGIYDGEPFDVTIEVNRRLELKLRPPLVVGDGDENVTFVVDILPCLRDPFGVPIDPRRLSIDASLRADVRDCIAQRHQAFEDHDHDADDDDSDSDSDGR